MAKGSTPASKSLSDVVEGINNIKISTSAKSLNFNLSGAGSLSVSVEQNQDGSLNWNKTEVNNSLYSGAILIYSKISNVQKASENNDNLVLYITVDMRYYAPEYGYNSSTSFVATVIIDKNTNVISTSNTSKYWVFLDPHSMTVSLSNFSIAYKYSLY